METDEDLIAQYLEGSEESFSALVARHVPSLYSFAFRFVGNQSDAEDITQETFLKVWKNLKKYSRQSASFKTWVMHIARNTAIDYLRKRKQVPFSHFEDAEGQSPFQNIADDTPLPDELSAKKDEVNQVEKVLQELPPLYREVLLLYYGNSFTLEEIAKILETPPNTVKSRYRRALIALRALVHQK